MTGVRDDDTDDGGDLVDDGARGAWLTYAYRFGSATVPHASGTIKAPSFGAAARRLLAERLADRIGSEPAFLRLRAAGEQEVLLQVTRPAGASGSPPTFVVVPSDHFRFERPEAPEPPGASERDAR